MQTIDLVRSLYDGSCVPVSELADRFDVSVRTVRAHIHEANELLANIALIRFSRSGNGYRLEIEDDAALNGWLDRGSALAVSTAASASDERVSYLLNDLLSRTDWVTVSDLASVLYVSPQSISADLKRVEAALAPFNLTLEKRPHRGVRIDGSEMSRRLCLASVVSGSLSGSYQVAGAAESDLLASTSQVASCIEDVIREASFSLSSMAFQNLAVHIVVALARIRENCYVPLDGIDIDRIRKASEFGVAQRIAAAISERTGVEMPEVEVAYIAIHLAGKKTLDDLVVEGDGNGDGRDAAGNLVISDEIWDVVGEMLESIWGAFRFDFRQDLELRMNLARHLVPLRVRLRYRLRVDNPLLADIKTRFPLAWSMALDACRVIENHFDAVLSQEETGFVALAFALALERERTEAPKKNILVVCASGVGSARLLEHRFRREFEGYIDECVACDAQGLDQIDFSNIDYVFSTVPLSQKLPVPVREVAYFFDAADADGIRRILSGEEGGGRLAAHFDRALFFPHLELGSREQVIDYLCDKAALAHPLSDDFRELVMRRERAAATSFGNMVAMPHPIEAASDETFVTVALLNQPIAWGGPERKVQAVFLVSFARAGGRSLDTFFSALADVFMDTDAMRRLVKHQNWSTLQSILRGKG